MKKSRDAFRTISEVAEWLDIPTHVLRFWESRFSQIKPVKRAGGRRYYRPSDMALIGGVKVLLHDDGMTIRGVQKLLREQGIRHVAGFSPEIDGEVEDAGDVIDHKPQGEVPNVAAPPATSTHAATPAPSAEEDEEVADTSDQGEMFETSDDNAEPESAVSEEVGEDAAAESVAQEDTPFEDEDEPVDLTAPPDPRDEKAPGPAPKSSIPDTPDVPRVDAPDDDETKPAKAGVAARLVVMSPADLEAHRDVIQSARDRLAALRASAAE